MTREYNTRCRKKSVSCNDTKSLYQDHLTELEANNLDVNSSRAEAVNLKHMVINQLQDENEKLHYTSNNLNTKVVTLDENSN